MSWSDRRTVLAGLGAAALAGCGFTPAYGPGGSAEGMRGRIRVGDPVTRDDFNLKIRLEERLGPPAAADYVLSVALDVEEVGLAVTAAQETTRYNVVGEATYRLRPMGSETVVASGTVDNFTSYNATGTVVATTAAAQDARERLMVILADQIATRLIATAPTWLE